MKEIVELCVQSGFLCCLTESMDEKWLVIVATHCGPQRLLQTVSQRLFSHNVQYCCHNDQSLCAIYLKWTKRLCHKPQRHNPDISKVHCTPLLRSSPASQYTYPVVTWVKYPFYNSFICPDIFLFWLKKKKSAIKYYSYLNLHFVAVPFSCYSAFSAIYAYATLLYIVSPLFQPAEQLYKAIFLKVNLCKPNKWAAG